MMNKKIKLLFFTILLSLNNAVFSQSKEWVEYLELHDSATNLYNLAKYAEAKNFFDKMFSIKNKFYYENDFYHYIYCLASIRDTIAIEPYLLELVQKKWFEYKHLKDIYDPLHTQSYWNKIDSIAIIKDNDKNYFMIDSLAKMAEIDQKIRHIRSEAKTDTTLTTHYKDSLLYLNYSIDTSNVAKLKELIALYGFPTWKLVGIIGSYNAWLIAQHASPEFREWYFEQYKQAVEENNASIKYYAFLIDRIRIWTEAPQLYGTQWRRYVDHLLLPVEDIEHLNDRRETVLLPPIDISKITISETFPYIKY